MSAHAGLIRFRYLKRQRLLTMMLILVAASTLFSITAFSLLGFYRGFNAYMGEGQDTVAIYNRPSRTPFTGAVPAYLTEDINAVNGVIASSPEILVPCLLKDKPIFLRGIIPEDFTELNKLTLTDGSMLELGDTNSLIAGKNIAEKLNLKLNDTVLITGVLTAQYITLQVKGIYESNAAMDDEVLAPLYVGQWLRGTDYGHVTLIRVKVDKNATTQAAIFEAIAKEASSTQTPSQGESQKPAVASIIPNVRAYFNIGDIGVKNAQSFMSSYLDSYGVSENAILILSVMVLLFSSASVTVASKTIITQHRKEILILKSIGASERTIKLDMLVKLLPFAVVASTIGIIAAASTLMIIQERGYLQVLSHTVAFEFNPVVIAANLIVVCLLLTVSILKLDIK